MERIKIAFYGLCLLTIGGLNVFGQSAAVGSGEKSKPLEDAAVAEKDFDFRHAEFAAKNKKFTARKKSDEDFAEDYSRLSPDYSKKKSAAQQSAEPSPISSDRPSFSTGPQLVSTAFKAQIESGYTFTRSGGGKNHALGELLVRVPVAESVELRFGVPSYQFQRGDSHASGLGDSSIGAKIKLTDAGEKTGIFSKPATAIVVSTTLPTGSNFFGSGDLQPQASFATSTSVTGKVGLATNFGYVRADDGGGNNYNQFFGALVLSRSLTKRVGGYFEVYGQSRLSAASSDGAKYADTGLTYLIGNNSQLDARFGIGLGNRAAGPDYFFGFGYSQRF